MFASNRGPIFARQGDSTIQIDVEGGNITQDMDDWRLVVLFYHVDSFETFSTIEDQVELLACTDDTEHVLALTGMSAVQKQVFPVQNETVKASAQYIVNTSGWTNTQIFICSDRNGAAEVLPFKGTMEIRNPFGLLPAVLYGMIPFSALLTVGYLMLFGFFSVLLVRHRKQVIQLHYGILLVLLMGTAATAAWFYAFFRMNQTGEPVCCPYPTTFLVAVVLDTLMRTLARLILIVVCLGYGIVRAHLRRGEVVLVTFLSLAYFVSGIGDEVTRGTSSGIEFREKPTAWTLVQLLCNLMFIMWIHYSLEQIIKQLSEQKQSAKLAMYKSLAWSLAGFIVFFTLLTLVAVCSRVGVFDWDVEWEWMQLVAWPVLNFIVSAAMCVIWRPTKNSSQFAFSMQLPMSADDAEDGATGIEMPSPFAHTSDSEDEEIFNASDMVSRDEIEIELSPAKDMKTGKKTVHHADDDDEEGL
ncbi:hypothetical protein Poli38472_003724 [Pythium oligandrum]|uniref:GOST seven transmembrane domain-containing protein n=1 Tax=Pythium oligandrum TaxID=41045 RepID=A0A8K1CMS3_PYTOL|nr:hypothetical protein Poli38472_003724 [Pythium oligandrum]|eukprot:TMW65959.1 hypothetical protein Poli38472_003724 [Pythium oligandrum]